MSHSARTAGGDWRRSRTIRRRDSLNRSAHGRIGLWPTRKCNGINGDFASGGKASSAVRFVQRANLIIHGRTCCQSSADRPPRASPSTTATY
jgi:hypothetical protein